jgi:hypothetical protein
MVDPQPVRSTVYNVAWPVYAYPAEANSANWLVAVSKTRSLLSARVGFTTGWAWMVAHRKVAIMANQRTPW